MECTYFEGSGNGGQLGLLKVFLRFCQVQSCYLNLIAESTLRILNSILACQTCTKRNTQAYLIVPRFRYTGTKLPDKIKENFSPLFQAQCHIYQARQFPTPLHIFFSFLALLFTVSVLQKDGNILSLNIHELIL